MEPDFDSQKISRLLDEMEKTTDVKSVISSDDAAGALCGWYRRLAEEQTETALKQIASLEDKTKKDAQIALKAIRTLYREPKEYYHALSVFNDALLIRTNLQVGLDFGLLFDRVRMKMPWAKTDLALLLGLNEEDVGIIDELKEGRITFFNTELDTDYTKDIILRFASLLGFARDWLQSVFKRISPIQSDFAFAHSGIDGVGENKIGINLPCDFSSRFDAVQRKVEQFYDELVNGEDSIQIQKK